MSKRSKRPAKPVSRLPFMRHVPRDAKVTTWQLPHERDKPYLERLLDPDGRAQGVHGCADEREDEETRT